jgi:hypothetical protein
MRVFAQVFEILLRCCVYTFTGIEAQHLPYLKENTVCIVRNHARWATPVSSLIAIRDDTIQGYAEVVVKQSVGWVQPSARELRKGLWNLWNLLLQDRAFPTLWYVPSTLTQNPTHLWYTLRTLHPNPPPVSLRLTRPRGIYHLSSPVTLN